MIRNLRRNDSIQLEMASVCSPLSYAMVQRLGKAQLARPEHLIGLAGPYPLAFAGPSERGCWAIRAGLPARLAPFQSAANQRAVGFAKHPRLASIGALASGSTDAAVDH